MAHGGSHAVDVTGCSGNRLGNHVSPRIEDACGEIARFAHHGGETCAHKGRGLLVGYGDKAVPENLEGDRIKWVRFHIAAQLDLPMNASVCFWQKSMFS